VQGKAAELWYPETGTTEPASYRIANGRTTVPLRLDANEAVFVVFRKPATTPSSIGLMGFSAGGHVVSGVALGYTAGTRPDFVAPIYAFVGSLKDKTAASDAPPMFIAAATDDGLVPGSVQLYNQWLAAKRPVEIHLYAKGGHGFGMRRQNLPTNQWIERFGDWLQMQALLKK
jgi:acetyl esterase/lipase